MQAKFTGVAIVLIDVSLKLTKLFFCFRSIRKHPRARDKEKKCVLALAVNKSPAVFLITRA